MLNTRKKKEKNAKNHISNTSKKGEIWKKPRITFQISRKNIYRYILNNKKGKKQAHNDNADNKYLAITTKSQR